MSEPDQSDWPGVVNQKVRQRFMLANGLRFELAECGPKDSDKLVICLHGFPELNYSWRFQMQLLARRGWRVWAPNMRGYGRSDRPEGIRPYALDHLTQDVAALIDAAKAEHPAKQLMLMAHDWGAIVAWHFAAQQLRHIDQLVIMNVPHPKVLRREIFKWRQVWKSWYIFFFQLPKIPERFLTKNGAQTIKDFFLKMTVDDGNFDTETLQHYADAALQPGAATAMVNYYRALLRHRDVAPNADEKIETPVLMVWGKEDSALNIRCSEGNEEWAPNLTLRRLPGVSHWVQQEAPEKVNAILDSWLDEQSGKGA